MHHAYDEVPAQVNLDFRNNRLEVTDHSHAVYDTTSVMLHMTRRHSKWIQHNTGSVAIVWGL
jgi:hypothetical protein